jgi:hypothetical protein
MGRMRRIATLASLALLAGCVSVPKTISIRYRIGAGARFSYRSEAYGTVVDTVRRRVSSLTSTTRDISVIVSGIKAGQYTTLRAKAEHSAFTSRGTPRVAWDSDDGSTAAAARKHPMGVFVYLTHGNPIQIVVMSEGGILKATSDGAMSAARKLNPGQEWAAKVQNQIDILAASIVFNHRFPETIRPGDRWQEVRPLIGPCRLETAGVKIFKGPDSSGGRRCVLIETVVEAPPSARGLIYEDWEAWSKSWVDIETGVLVRSTFRLNVEVRLGKEGRLLEGNLRGGVRLVNGTWPED